MAGVRLERLRKEFGHGVVAVSDIDLEIGHGEFVTLVGPSGCGKTTTLRMIAGLEEPTSGRVRFDEEDITRLEPRDRNIAMVFQSYALYPHMTVRSNIEYGLKKRRVPAAERAVKVRNISAMLRIEELLDRKPRELSGGQRQRVALGRALIRNPKVFLLDEPLSNLDAKLRVQMRAELIALHQSIATTMIYVTHDQLEAMTMSDRIVVMHRGHIQQIGTPEEIYTRPANLFVAEFIGTPSMNIVPGTVARAGDRLRFHSSALSVDLVSEPIEGLKSDKVRLGFRPEDVDLVSAGDRDATVARVAVSELAGAERYLFLTLTDATVIARVPASTRVEAGDAVAFRINPAKLHLFDDETERSIALP